MAESGLTRPPAERIIAGSNPALGFNVTPKARDDYLLARFFSGLDLSEIGQCDHAGD